METIYLSGTKEAVLNDLKKLNPEITEQLPELSGEGWAAHWIGKILLEPPIFDPSGGIIKEAVLTESSHANIWVFDSYPHFEIIDGESVFILPVFDTEIPEPRNPVNKLA